MLTLADGKPTAGIADHKGELREYDVEVLDAPPAAPVVVRFTRRDTDAVYVVRLHPERAICTCPQWTYRCSADGTECKHCTEARELLKTLAAAAALFRGPLPLPVAKEGVP